MTDYFSEHLNPTGEDPVTPDGLEWYGWTDLRKGEQMSLSKVAGYFMSVETQVKDGSSLIRLDFVYPDDGGSVILVINIPDNAGKARAP